MAYYVVNKNKDSHGVNEIHKTDCSHKPYSSNCYDLGYCSSDQEAIRKAKALGYNPDGCYYCCPSVHTR